MNDNMVKAFISIYECKSIGEAARVINQSKTNVRQNLLNLEKNLGINLFIRSREGMRPTEDAKKMYDIMKYLQFNINELERFYNINKEASGLRIATNYIEHVAYCFSKTVEDLGNDKSIYSYKNTTTDDVVDMIIKDKCDIGIFCFDSELKPVVEKLSASNDLYYKTLMISPPAIYVRENHPLANKEALVPIDLFGYGRIALNISDKKILNYVPNMARSSMPPKPEISVDAISSVVGFLQSSDYYYIGIDCPQGKKFIESLKIIPIKYKTTDMHIVWCCRKGYLLNKEGTYFLRMLEDFFNGGLLWN